MKYKNNVIMEKETILEKTTSCINPSLLNGKIAKETVKFLISAYSVTDFSPFKDGKEFDQVASLYLKLYGDDMDKIYCADDFKVYRIIKICERGVIVQRQSANLNEFYISYTRAFNHFRFAVNDVRIGWSEKLSGDKPLSAN